MGFHDFMFVLFFIFELVEEDDDIFQSYVMHVICRYTYSLYPDERASWICICWHLCRYIRLILTAFDFSDFSLVFREPGRGQLLGLYLCVLHMYKRSLLSVSA
jgi:hypothetical protein